ncbi:kinase-like protein [Exidia glandulosa HHB12029]|uniref:Kinase-like protein n=1 Tax=Exidia glandulosa HHB12029 TaxID=1314781 RepID=A0A165KMC4_EXIGL|nr:kinase-like protein [Exidia glandulosa HHB12029]
MTHFRGTLRWMAPELLCDDPVATPASDIWAYGCIMVEVFSGSRPYIDKASDNAVVLALSRRQMPSRPEGMSNACWKLARKCFEYNPSKRVPAVDIIRDPVFTSEPPFHSSVHNSAGSGVWRPIQGIVSAAASAINSRQRKRIPDSEKPSPWEFPPWVNLPAEVGKNTGLPANSEEANSTASADTAHWNTLGDMGIPSERVSSDSESAPSSDRDDRCTGSSDADSASDSNPYRTEVLYSYTASPDDPNELSVVKGEFVEVLDTQDEWWQARNADGVIGIVPSNCLRAKIPNLFGTPKETSGSTQVVQIDRAKALYSYAASPDDPNEVSFSKDEIIEILSHDGKWWLGRKADGSMGIVPSNYLQIL